MQHRRSISEGMWLIQISHKPLPMSPAVKTYQTHVTQVSGAWSNSYYHKEVLPQE